ncbi:FecR family protein [Idiomarina piscisalsi]|uniref:FecR protein domain-containing protein n=1 Tax=Idiomarina piscisalsi TaxID=1096243 RepID=A0A432YWQ4_9GAMM|nr:FecR domain-containing protein [Idiomarina piscisalsi]RUO67760.1 hypothetical protein CWI73_02570 [Idiomarina piscisalsi]
MSRDNQLQRQAAYYVTRLFSGELTADEEREIQNWRKESASHEREFNAMLTIWQRSETVYRSVNRASIVKRAFALAASIVLTSITVYLLVNALPAFLPASQNVQPDQLVKNERHNEVIMRQPFRSSIGEIRKIELPDGSTVTLNTDSDIFVTLTNEKRLVKLRRGEVFFNIQKEQSRPFIIDTGEQKVTVLGTRFTVRKNAAEDAVKVSVIEGVVEFETLQTDSKHQTQLLTSGDIATYQNQTKKISLTRLSTRSIQPGWIQGVLRFDNTPLPEVIAELNRYRSTKIKIAFTQQEQLRISGVFHLHNSDSVLNAITATLPVKIRKTENSIELLKK